MRRSVRELPWGAASWDAALPAFDVVLAADVVYRHARHFPAASAPDAACREDSAALLVETIACAIPTGSQAPFLLGMDAGGDRDACAAAAAAADADCHSVIPLLLAGFTNRVIGADVFFDGM